MTQESAVHFDTNRRIHMALAVKNLEKSVAFYRRLLGMNPTKTRPGYAKFELADPPVNLSLNESREPTGPNNAVAHYGIQVKSTAAVNEMQESLAKAGVKSVAEDEVTCCYAVQSKIWVTDPDGNKWEVFVVTNNEGAHHHASVASASAPCCDSNQCCVAVDAK